MAEHGAGGSFPALRTERLGRRYGKAWGLRECTFELPAGAVAALVGPKGAGKTTAFNLITGVYQPTGGAISFHGHPTTNLKPHQLAKRGIALSAGALTTALTQKTAAAAVGAMLIVTTAKAAVSVAASRSGVPEPVAAKS